MNLGVGAKSRAHSLEVTNRVVRKGSAGGHARVVVGVVRAHDRLDPRHQFRLRRRGDDGTVLVGVDKVAQILRRQVSVRRVTNTRRNEEQNRVDARAKQPESQDVRRQLGDVFPAVLVPGLRRHRGLLLRASRKPNHGVASSVSSSSLAFARPVAGTTLGPKPSTAMRRRRQAIRARPRARAFAPRTTRIDAHKTRAPIARVDIPIARAHRACTPRDDPRIDRREGFRNRAPPADRHPRPRSRAQRAQRAAIARRTRARIRIRSFAPPSRSSFRTCRRRTGVDRRDDAIGRKAARVEYMHSRVCDSRVTYVNAQIANEKSTRRGQKSVFESVLTTSARTAASPAAMTSPW